MEMRKIEPIKVPRSDPAHILCSCGRVATMVHTDTQTGIQGNVCSDCYDIESCREEGFAETGEYYSDEEVIQILESRGWERSPELVRMSDQPANVTTDVAIRVFETTPAVVSFNYQEISDHLDGVLEKYRGLVFSDNDVAECKKTIAELRKGQKSLDEFRKATKKQLTESVTAFETQCKVLYCKFETVITPLTLQQAQFEADRRELKRVEIQSFIDTLIADHLLADKYAVQLVILEEYFNKGKKLKDVKTELSSLANTLSIKEDKEAQDIDLIKTKVQLANAQYQLLPPRDLKSEQYLRLLSYQSVFNIDLLITTDAQNAKKTYDAFDAIPEAVHEVELVITPTHTGFTQTRPPEITPEVKTILYEIAGTEEQLTALEGYLDANDLSWIDRPELQIAEDEEDDSFLD